MITEEEYEYSSLIDNNNSEDNSNESSEPEDRFGVVRITFGLIGLSQLIPWNFMITANDYWNFKFRYINETHNTSKHSFRETNTELTSLQKYFESYLSIATNLTFLLTLIFNVFLGHKIADQIKNFWTFITIIVIFILMTIFVKINTDFHQNLFFGLTIVSIIVLSVCAAFIQSSIAGIASLFPPQCMHAMVNGQAISGLFASLAQLLALLGHWEVTQTALYYFLMADITLIFSLFMFFLMKSTDYYKYHKQKVHQIRRQLNSFLESNEQNYFRSIVKSIWMHLISSLLVFWVSLSVFPALTVLIVPQYKSLSKWSTIYFTPITCFLLFNFSDLMGRFAGKFCQISRQKRILLFTSILRIILVPLIMLCNAMPDNRTYLPILFKSEVFYIIFVTILGFTNGYVLINIMVSGPNFVSDHYKESVGFFLVSFMGLGLALGSFTSNILIHFL